MPLTETERISLQGIQARQALLQHQIQADLSLVLRDIEQRLELPAGSIPITHRIEMDADPPVVMPMEPSPNGSKRGDE